MARQKWLAGQAFTAIRSGGSNEDRVDIAKRYPLFATATAEEIVKALDGCNLTARKVEKALRGDVAGGEEEGETEAPAKAAKGEEKAAKGKRGRPKKEEKPAKEEKSAKKGKAAKAEDKPAKGKGKAVPKKEEEDDSDLEDILSDDDEDEEDEDEDEDEEDEDE